MKSLGEIHEKLIEDIFHPQKKSKKRQPPKRNMGWAVIVALIIIFFVITGSLFFSAIHKLGQSTSEVTQVIIENTSVIITSDLLESGYNSLPQTINYPYVLNGTHKTIKFTTYGIVDTYFEKKDPRLNESTSDGIITKLVTDKDQDNYLKPLINEIKKESPDRDEQAKIAISLVQNIPYNKTRADNIDNNIASEWQYPYETLYLNSGVCSDNAVLLIYILNELGYDAAYLEFNTEGHAAVGIKTILQYSYQNTGYAFVESTRPTIITYPKNKYGNNKDKDITISSTPRIILFTGGQNILDISQEYKDAITYDKLKNQQGLTPSQFRQLEILVWKYGLQHKLDGQYLTEDPTNKPLCKNKAQLCNDWCYDPCPKGEFVCTFEGGRCR